MKKPTPSASSMKKPNVISSSTLPKVKSNQVLNDSNSIMKLSQKEPLAASSVVEGDHDLDSKNNQKMKIEAWETSDQHKNSQIMLSDEPHIKSEHPDLVEVQKRWKKELNSTNRDSADMATFRPTTQQIKKGKDAISASSNHDKLTKGTAPSLAGKNM